MKKSKYTEKQIERYKADSERLRAFEREYMPLIEVVAVIKREGARDKIIEHLVITIKQLVEDCPVNEETGAIALKHAVNILLGRAKNNTDETISFEGIYTMEDLVQLAQALGSTEPEDWLKIADKMNEALNTDDAREWIDKIAILEGDGMGGLTRDQVRELNTIVSSLEHAMADMKLILE